MDGEDFGTWLSLEIGGGGDGCAAAARRSHGELRPPVQLDVLFPQHVRAERGRDHEQVKGGKGAKRRISIGDSPGPSDGGSDGGTRKKLRLTIEQSKLLEDSFRAHNILSHGQKQELARRLNLTSRQVEVWFQNRRARTKLKQTEIDCEFLKRCCESLTEENKRLKHELVKLQRSAAGPELCLQLPNAAATVNFCPSCEKVTMMSGSAETSSKSSSYCC